MQIADLHDRTAATSNGLFRAALVAGGVFLAWKFARGLRDLFWSVAGIGFAAYWCGFWPF